MYIDYCEHSLCGLIYNLSFTVRGFLMADNTAADTTADTMAAAANNDHPRRALIICDMQIATLNSVPDVSRRRALVDFIRTLVEAVRASNKHAGCFSDAIGRRRHIQIVQSGLAFSSHYHELSEYHKVLGSLKRLHRLTSKDGSTASKFFVAGDASTQFVLQPSTTTVTAAATGKRGEVGEDDDKTIADVVVWRSSLLPDLRSDQWKEALRGATDVTVVGLKTALAIQATVQGLWDVVPSLQKVSVIRECILDDQVDRHKALVQHLLPLYADVVDMADWMKEQSLAEWDDQSATVEWTIESTELDPNVRYFCDCGRGGHAFLYQQHLLLFHQGWARYPIQHWYTEGGLGGLEGGKSYKCPLGKRVIDFCDEPKFSKYCMYIMGREWLDEKEKVWELMLQDELMPKTYLVQGRQWQNRDFSTGAHENAPFFVKDCQKNGGKAVQVVASLDDALISVDSNAKFVVQAHVPEPFLTHQGHKCHIKSYFLLFEDGSGIWDLHMYPEAFLSVSTNPWSPNDLRPETQITVKRTERLFKGKPCSQWDGWPSSYDSVRTIVSQVVEKAVAQGKLQSRSKTAVLSVGDSDHQPLRQRQFEIFSADVMVDVYHRPWLIECNFGCVMYDPNIGQPLTTIGLRTYQRLYKEQGEAAQVNDHTMIAEAMRLVFGPERTTSKKDFNWELVGTYR